MGRGSGILRPATYLQRTTAAGARKVRAPAVGTYQTRYLQRNYHEELARLSHRYLRNHEGWEGGLELARLSHRRSSNQLLSRGSARGTRNNYLSACVGQSSWLFFVATLVSWLLLHPPSAANHCSLNLFWLMRTFLACSLLHVFHNLHACMRYACFFTSCHRVAGRTNSLSSFPFSLFSVSFVYFFII
jgi:hypothetical protein